MAQARGRMGLPLLGLGLCWTWRAIISPLCAGGAVSLFALLAASILVFLLRGRLEDPGFFRGAVALTCVVGMLGAGVLVVLADVGTARGIAVMVASLLTHLTSSLCMLLWIGPFSAYSMRAMGMGLGAAYLAGSVAFLALALLPEMAMQGAAVVMPAILCLLMVYDVRSSSHEGKLAFASDAGAEPGHGRPDVGQTMALIPWRTVLVVAVFNVAAGVNRAHTAVFDDMIAMGVSGMLMAVVTWMFARRYGMYLVYRVFLPIMMVGLLAGLLFGRQSTVAQACINASYAFSNAVLMLYVCDAARRFRGSAFGMFSIARLVAQLCFSGTVWLAGMLSLAGTFGGVDVANVVYAVALLAVALAVMFWLSGEDPARAATELDERDLGLIALSIEKTMVADEKMGDAHSVATLSAEGSFLVSDGSNETERADWSQDRDASGHLGATNPTAFSASADGGTASASTPNDLLGSIIGRRCAELAEEYRLSERELDILTQLAWGRGVKRIEEELVISASTVKTHIRHVYAKMGIHTRAELEALLGIGAR